MNKFGKFKNQALTQKQKIQITGGRIYRCYVGGGKQGYQIMEIEAGNHASATQKLSYAHKGDVSCEYDPWSLGNEY